MHRYTAVALSAAVLATGLLSTGTATAQTQHLTHLSSPADAPSCHDVTIDTPQPGSVYQGGGRVRIDIHNDPGSIDTLTAIDLLQIQPNGQPPTHVEKVWEGEEKFSGRFSLKDSLPNTGLAGDFFYRAEVNTAGDGACRVDSSPFTIAH
ncbi:hypothetical protein ACWFRJ_43495 [Streptomyces sp. NPDC055239]